MLLFSGFVYPHYCSTAQLLPPHDGRTVLSLKYTRLGPNFKLRRASNVDGIVLFDAFV